MKYISKKKKMVLKWFVPATIIAIGAIGTSSIFLIKEKIDTKKIDSIENIVPTSFNDISNENLSILEFNPKQYDANFFLYGIGNSFWINDVFEFYVVKNGIKTSLEKIIITDEQKNIIDIYWEDKNSGVDFKIESISSDLKIIDNNYQFNLVIKKSYNDVWKKYNQTIKIPTSSFSSSSQSTANFAGKISSIINNMFAEQSLKLGIIPSKIDSITNIEQIENQTDLELTFNQNLVSINSVKKGEEIIYSFIEKEYEYLGKETNFTFPISEGTEKLVFSSNEAYSFSANNVFNKNSKLFTFLKGKYQIGQLNNLPELTDEEKEGLTTDDEILDKKIQKLIFDYNKYSYTLDNYGNKIPLETNQAIILKSQLDNSISYAVVWTNLFQPTSSIVLNAPELQMIATTNNGVELNYEDIQNSKNYVFIQPTEKPSNNLVYTVEKIEFSQDDEYFVSPNVIVKVSSPFVSETKTYTTTLSGFKSKAYVEMENQIKSIIGEQNDLGLLSPTLTLKEGVQWETIVNSNLSDLNSLMEKISIKKSQNIENFDYVPTFAWIDGNELKINFKISSIYDSKNYWKVMGVEQEIMAILSKPSNK